jgi:antirestriction protein ArdC
MDKDVYTQVTQTIVAQLEQGERPWIKPWSAAHAAGPVSRPLRHNSVPYSGINVLMLWVAAMEKGYSAPLWMTFRQAKELGGHVRKGEHGSTVVYANAITKTEQDPDTGEDVEKHIPFMKGYTVFNVEQIEGLPPLYYATAEAPRLDPDQRIAHAEQFVANTGATLIPGGNRAFYAPGPDEIHMPRFETFRDPESYYATGLHELTHWTRHPSRLDRDLGRKKWGDQGYAMEELVAELGAAFLCADLGITAEVRPDHADYIGDWLKVLKSDNRAIFTAAAHAEKAAAFLHGRQPAPAPEPDPATPPPGAPPVERLERLEA